MLNLKTGLTSPQFHVIYDDDFTIVPHLRADTVPPNWAALVQHSRERSSDGCIDLTKTWFQATDDPLAEDFVTVDPANKKELGDLFKSD